MRSMQSSSRCARTTLSPPLRSDIISFPLNLIGMNGDELDWIELDLFDFIELDGIELNCMGRKARAAQPMGHGSGILSVCFQRAPIWAKGIPGGPKLQVLGGALTSALS